MSTTTAPSTVDTMKTALAARADYPELLSIMQALPTLAERIQAHREILHAAEYGSGRDRYWLVQYAETMMSTDVFEGATFEQRSIMRQNLSSASAGAAESTIF